MWPEQYSTVQYSTVQYSTVQYSTVQYSTVQYSKVQYSTVQYNTVQYSTVQYSTVLRLMGLCNRKEDKEFCPLSCCNSHIRFVWSCFDMNGPVCAITFESLGSWGCLKCLEWIIMDVNGLLWLDKAETAKIGWILLESDILNVQNFTQTDFRWKKFTPKRA